MFGQVPMLILYMLCPHLRDAFGTYFIKSKAHDRERKSLAPDSDFCHLPHPRDSEFERQRQVAHCAPFALSGIA